MRDAPQFIVEGVRQLDVISESCICCSEPLRTSENPCCSSTITADAGQAYEVLDRSLIEASVMHLERVVSQHNLMYLTVCDSNRALVSEGGCVVGNFVDRTVLTSKTIFTALRALLQLRTFVLGSWFVK